MMEIIFEMSESDASEDEMQQLEAMHTGEDDCWRDPTLRWLASLLTCAPHHSTRCGLEICKATRDGSHQFE